jgi:hypothetical protein
VKHLLYLFAGLAACASTAEACQCDDPASLTAAEQAERAAWIAKQNFIIAEVVRLPTANHQDPERYRVVRQIVGAAPDEITVQHDITVLPNGERIIGPITSCDYSAAPGQQAVMAFTSVGTSPGCGLFATLSPAALRPAGMCVQYAVQHAATLGQVVRLSRGTSR